MKLNPLFIIVLTSCCFIGCVRRTITITSTPPGALVHLNDQEIGKTPITTKFTFYGTYDVRLKKAGYVHIWQSKKAVAPWWEFPGPDLIAELIPNNKVALHWDFKLKPVKHTSDIPLPTLLIHHASQLRLTTETTPKSKPQTKK